MYTKIIYSFLSKAVIVVIAVALAVSTLGHLIAAVLVVSTLALPTAVAPEAQEDLVANTQAKTTTPAVLSSEYDSYKQPINKYYLRQTYLI